MSGGLLQLVAYGAQDVYLCGNPQMTFFKYVYTQHTNYSMESMCTLFTGRPHLGSKLSCSLKHSGDLVSKMCIEITYDVSVDSEQTDSQPCESMVFWVHRFGHALLESVEVEIDGQVIDRQSGEWLELWSQLTLDELSLSTLRTLIGGSVRTVKNGYKMYIPLQFWFNRVSGLALPLIALQKEDIKINVELKSRSDLHLPGNFSIREMQLCSDFIFLDKDERRRFATGKQEYLIEQVQETPEQSLAPDVPKAFVKLPFSLPCKEVVWFAQPLQSGYTSGKASKPFLFSHQLDFSSSYEISSGIKYREFHDTVLSARLMLNGQDRFTPRHGTYFRCVQPYQHHTGGGFQGRVSSARASFENYGTPCGEGWKPHATDGSTTYFHNPTDGIHGVYGEDGYFYTYSFGLYPEEHQPSGTLNFSRIENATLCLDIVTRQMIVKNSPQLNNSSLYMFQGHEPTVSDVIRWSHHGEFPTVGDPDWFADSVAISRNGTMIAVGAIYDRDENGIGTGTVRVYKLSGGQWNQFKNTLNFSTVWRMTVSVANKSIEYVAVGVQTNLSGGGYVRNYKSFGSTWRLLVSSFSGNSEFDFSRTAVSLNENGTIIALGGPKFNGAGNNRGRVRAYKYQFNIQNEWWDQLGSDITGSSDNDFLGTSVSMDNSGTVLAVGINGASGSSVKVYKYQSNSWGQHGSTIVANFSTGYGTIVSLSGNGSTIAMGFPSSAGSRVQVASLENTSWQLQGTPLEWSEAQDLSISLSSDGTTLAVGIPSDNSETGTVQVYKYNTANWSQYGTSLVPSAAGTENYGGSVSLSKDGSKLGIGSMNTSTFLTILRSEETTEILPVDNYVKRLKVYATNYNVLRIQNGKGGLVFAC